MPIHRLRFLIVGLMVLLSLAAPPGRGASASAQTVAAFGAQIKVPDEAQPIMPLKDVRVGMTGYGLTIFRGTHIEPFAVRVVAVVPNTEAKRSTFWVVCDHPTLDLSGPVQGMSGSPIYLWDPGTESEEQTIGQGGKLAGAFAFGYGGVRECLAGIQPIELMRDVAARTPQAAQVAQQVAQQAARQAAPSRAAIHHVAAGLKQLADHGQSASTRIQARLLHQAFGPGFGPGLNRAAAPASPSAVDDQTPGPLALPISVGHPAVAAALTPLLKPAGLHAIAGVPHTGAASPVGAQTFAGAKPLNGPALISAQPHPDIDPRDAFIQPGSAVCVPFAWGDLDLSGNGTVTDVLPDGTVLAFGHAMDGLGDTAMPMATGYVHFVVPSRQISFRQAGALSLQGTILRDENAAIAARGKLGFDSAPVKVTVNINGQPQRDYHYRVLKHPTITAPIASAVVANSLTAVQSLPQYNTTTATLKAVFSNGRQFTQQVQLPVADPGALVEATLPLTAAVLANPFEHIALESLEAVLNVSTDDESAQITEAWLSRLSARPGETVDVFVRLQPFRGPAYTLTLPFTVPQDAAPDRYALTVGDRTALLQARLNARPDIAAIDDVDALFASIDLLTEPGFRSVHAVMPTLGNHVAMSDRTLTDLPSSKAALFIGAGPGRVSPATKLYTASQPTPNVTRGQQTLTLQVLPPVDDDNNGEGRRRR